MSLTFDASFKAKRATLFGPVEIGVVPFIPGGDLFCRTRLRIDDEDMASAIVEPTRIVELVRDMRVMSHIASVFILAAIVARPDTTQAGKPLSVGRPLKAGDS